MSDEDPRRSQSARPRGDRRRRRRRVPPLGSARELYHLNADTRGAYRERAWQRPARVRRPSIRARSTTSSAPRARALRDPRRRRQAAAAALRRSPLPRRRCRATRWRATARRATTDVVLGTRHAKKPLVLDIPITIAGMSFGALSAQREGGAGPRRDAVGTSTTTGDGGMTPEERESLEDARLPVLPSRYGFNPDDLRRPTPSRSSSGRAPSPAAAACCWARRSPTASPRCATCPRASTSARPAATPTGPARTTS